MKEITSNIIGKLIQDKQFKDWWKNTPVEIPFFENKALKITFMDFTPEKDKEFIVEADKAVKNFLLKNEVDRLKLSELVYKNCMDFLNAVGYDEDDAPLWEMKNKNEIWN
ncbi:MAG: hypothetical protein ACI85O_002258 [Saprospiraceae bacterium]|jgi:hypothetical protein